MDTYELVSLEMLKKLVEMRRNQPQITGDDIRVDCHTAHAYAEKFVELMPPPKPPQAQGF